VRHISKSRIGLATAFLILEEDQNFHEKRKRELEEKYDEGWTSDPALFVYFIGRAT
jgi:hypothetical protein